jgi:AcrR family transcriptional regulator
MMAAASQTALERALASGEQQSRSTPLDALKAARRMWLGELRLDMGALASELGISRATLYNWVGDRERLIAEVMWSLAERTIAVGRAVAAGPEGDRSGVHRSGGDRSGAEYISAVIEHYLGQLSAFEPARRFIERDPEFALRVLTTSRTSFQRRLTEAVRELIEEQVTGCGYCPPLDPDTLAYVLVRIGESFIFNNLITGTEPDLHKAVQASRVLLHAPPLADR